MNSYRLMGPARLNDLHGKQYTLMFISDYSYESHIYLSSKKDQVFDTFKNFETWLETHHPNMKIKYLHLDHGGEFTDDEFTQHL